MTVYTLSFSGDPIVILPADLAQLAGLQEGAIQVIPGEHSLTVASATPLTNYAARWETMREMLREQAAPYGLEMEDRRDEAYWAIVEPLLEDAERWMSSF